MNVTQLKELCIQFGKSLNDEDKDEWWCTDKGAWDSMSKRFIMWCNSNRNILEKIEVKDKFHIISITDEMRHYVGKDGGKTTNFNLRMVFESKEAATEYAREHCEAYKVVK